MVKPVKFIAFQCLGVMLLSYSCKTNKVDLSNLGKNGKIILKMERTPCYGACPVYTITLYSNGLLLYNGKKFTDKAGCYYRKASKEELKQFTNSVTNSGFFALVNKYPVSGKAPSDLPGCIIYFSNGKQEKTIEEHSWETPALLKEIHAKADSLIHPKILQFCDK